MFDLHKLTKNALLYYVYSNNSPTCYRRIKRSFKCTSKLFNYQFLSAENIFPTYPIFYKKILKLTLAWNKALSIFDPYNTKFAFHYCAIGLTKLNITLYTTQINLLAPELFFKF